MSPNPPIVRLEHVDVAIDGRRVLHDTCLAISRDQHWGIVGDNGSGKSTLLAVLAGKRWPAPGCGARTYDFGAGPERDAVTARERVALIGPELQDLYSARRWNFRARDIVLSGVTRTDIPRRNPNAAQVREALALLERLGLLHLADRRLLELSRGEQRRILIARALAFDPALLLLDEPASGLDAGARDELERLLETVARQAPIVATAHDRDELPAVVTDIARLDAGRLGRFAPEQDRREPSVPVNGKAPVDGEARDRHGQETVIVLERASVWLGGRAILKDLDWRLGRGEHWHVTGANGAGKSTLLRLLHGEVRPALGGEVRWPGLGAPPDVWTLRRRIALVSPELAARYLYPTRVFDAIASGLHASIGLTRRLSREQEERVAALLEELELDALGDRLLSTLSYGQRHRALIARTLVTGPGVVLLDEPWEGLDRHAAALVLRALERRMAAGAQIICVSHVGTRGLPLERELALRDGRIVNGGGSGGRR